MSDFTAGSSDVDAEFIGSGPSIMGTAIVDPSLSGKSKDPHSESVGDSTARARFDTETTHPHGVSIRGKATFQGTTSKVQLTINNREKTADELEPDVLKKLKSLTADRGALLQKKYESCLSNVEARKLDYLTWQVDRIQHAQATSDLNELGKLADLHEEIALRVKTLGDSVTEVLNQQRKGR